MPVSNRAGYVANRTIVGIIMQRFFFSIWQFFRHYAALKKVYQHAEAHVACVTDITVKFLQAVQVLVLDFDGVLAPHGASEPLPEVQRWLTSLMRGKTVNVFILSNICLLKRIT